jgi:hypothetical protein
MIAALVNQGCCRQNGARMCCGSRIGVVPRGGFRVDDSGYHFVGRRRLALGR